ncbi:MAG TPA: hypothetical protein VHY84_05350 [Bryobacteraceae bacterium]|jgi:hypothetical protein|nr:hypothetical protein [Bryobacteraceae bacterium]
MAGQAIAATPFDVQGPTASQTGEVLHRVLFDLGVEPSMTVNEAAAVLRWSYWKARRYFSQVDGICVSYQPKRYKRPYRTFTIPLSVFAREWQKMTGREPESTEIIHRRIALAGQK